MTTIGEMIDTLFDTREDYRIQRKLADSLKDDMRRQELAIIRAMDEAGTDSSRTDQATASIVEKEIVKIDDWDTFLAWVKRTKNWQMLERRIAQLATKEYIQHSPRHKPPRGVSVLPQRSLNLLVRGK